MKFISILGKGSCPLKLKGISSPLGFCEKSKTKTHLLVETTLGSHSYRCSHCGKPF